MRRKNFGGWGLLQSGLFPEGECLKTVQKGFISVLRGMRPLDFALAPSFPALSSADRAAPSLPCLELQMPWGSPADGEGRLQIRLLRERLLLSVITSSKIILFTWLPRTCFKTDLLFSAYTDLILLDILHAQFWEFYSNLLTGLLKWWYPRFNAKFLMCMFSEEQSPLPLWAQN